MTPRIMRCFSSSGSRARKPSPPRRSTRATLARSALFKVLDGLDRYHKAGATKHVYDAAARERLFAKMSRIADRLEAKARKGQGRAPPTRPATLLDCHPRGTRDETQLP